jgi:hypothetical protein
MSTKIWEAYRVREVHDVWEVLWDIRRRAEKNVRRTLTKLYDALIAEAKLPPEAHELLRTYATDRPIDPERFGYLDASRFVVENFRKTIGRSERSIWDLSVSVAVRRGSRRRFLLIPYPGSGLLSSSLAFLRRHAALADFHYQNSSDRPSHITAQAWAGRARTWEPLLDDDRWQDKLELSIVSVEGWFRIDPAWGLIRKEARRQMRDGKSAEQAVESVVPAVRDC